MWLFNIPPLFEIELIDHLAECKYVVYPWYEYVKCSYASESRNTDDFL